MADLSLDRRRCLKTLAGLGLGAPWLVRPAAAEGEPPPGAASVLRYLGTLAKPDGGYGWAGWDRSHLTPTYAAIGCYHLLKQEPPRKSALAAWVRANHPFAIKKLEHKLPVFDYQQLRALLWLREDPGALREAALGWTVPTEASVRYEEHGYPPFQLQARMLQGRELLGLTPEAVTPKLADFILERRRPNGSFNQVRAEDGGDGHVMHTWNGLQALRALGRPLDRRDETVRWLQACQLPNGGFTYRPGADVGGVDDVAYTHAAVRALHLLGAAPRDKDGAIRYLRSLRTSEGGFGDKPGWDANALATYHALDALEALGALEATLAMGASPAVPALPARPALPPDLKLYTIQVQAPGSGSVSDAVEVARALGIHLWGAKNSKAGWIEQAQAVADRRKVPVTFFMADEEYGTHLDLPGMGDYNHISDVMAPPRSMPGPSLAGKKALTWAEYRERRLGPLEAAGGLAYWQFGDNEEFARAVLDESVARGGYGAISTFHFGNPDFTNSEPWLYRYYGRLPYVGLQDAHGGDPWWWTDTLAGFRTFFLGTEPTWDAWRRALKNNWVAPVRHDATSRFETWRHGMPEVLAFLQAREAEWRWWGAQPESVRRPLAVLAVLRPEDTAEVGRPERGVAVRVRCWWNVTNQGVPKQERARLRSLTLDGESLEPAPTERRNAMGAVVDRYYLAARPELKPGRHTVTARVERLDGAGQETITQEFTVE